MEGGGGLGRRGVRRGVRREVGSGRRIKVGVEEIGEAGEVEGGERWDCRRRRVEEGRLKRGEEGTKSE